jgi:hypothetical protein
MKFDLMGVSSKLFYSSTLLAKLKVGNSYEWNTGFFGKGASYPNNYGFYLGF